VLLPDREDNKNGPSISGSANCSEPLFGLRVARVGQNDDRPCEYGLNICPGQAVLSAMFQVSIVPFET
jgi:hypothetical protein